MNPLINRNRPVITSILSALCVVGWTAVAFSVPFPQRNPARSAPDLNVLPGILAERGVPVDITDDDITQGPEIGWWVSAGPDFLDCIPDEDGTAAESWGLTAAPEELGNWSSHRLQAPYGDYEMHSVHYMLRHKTMTSFVEDNASPKHRVRVYVSSDDSPTSDPKALHTWTVDLDAGDLITGLNLVSLALPTPIVVPSGDHVYVEVEHEGVAFQTRGGAESARAISINMCKVSTGEPAVNAWWAYSTDAPHDWVWLNDLSAAYADYQSMVWINGYGVFANYVLP